MPKLVTKSASPLQNVTFNALSMPDPKPASKLGPKTFANANFHSCTDPYFSNHTWFQAIQRQIPEAKMFPSNLSCTRRPVVNGTLTQSFGRGRLWSPTVVVGLCAYSDKDSEVLDEVSNSLKFTSPQLTGVVLHVNSIRKGNLSTPLQANLQTLDDAHGNRRLILNPLRIPIKKFQGTILLGHLVNYAVAHAFGWRPAYYVMVAANQRFIGCGLEAYISTKHLTFGMKDLCDEHKSGGNKRGTRAITRAFPVLPNANGECWQSLCGDGHRKGSLIPLLGYLFSIEPSAVNLTKDALVNATWVRSAKAPFPPQFLSVLLCF